MAKLEGAVATLSKPVDPVELIALVDKAVGSGPTSN